MAEAQKSGGLIEKYTGWLAGPVSGTPEAAIKTADWIIEAPFRTFKNIKDAVVKAPLLDCAAILRGGLMDLLTLNLKLANTREKMGKVLSLKNAGVRLNDIVTSLPVINFLTTKTRGMIGKTLEGVKPHEPGISMLKA